MPKKPIYDTFFRGKFMFMDCKSFDDLIKCCEEQAEEFRKMKADKIKIQTNGDDDHFLLRTTDPVLAKKYQMQIVEEG